MPSYVKFMKDILSKKRKLGGHETISLTEECSAIVQRRLPPKLKDPGKFTIPCHIGTDFFGHALCDLGASINLMPFFGVQETEHRGVKVDRFIFPADFVILDYEEDREVPIILGRPFLATGRTLIDVQKGELTMRVHDQEVTFNMDKAMKMPNEVDECRYVDILEEVTVETILEAYELPTEDALLDETSEEEAAFVRQFQRVEPLDRPETTIKPSIEEPPKLELKPLPDHLRYSYLGKNNTLPVIISSSLTNEQEEMLLRVLREHQTAIGWTIADIKGISPAICMHKIVLDSEKKASVGNRQDELHHGELASETRSMLSCNQCARGALGCREEVKHIPRELNYSTLVSMEQAYERTHGLASSDDEAHMNMDIDDLSEPDDQDSPNGGDTSGSAEF
ncbi:hypothetical protein MLD38_009904 [Melastoma candidum]|uniref:Uncharacterized protein n=1 Tax=Melastoma candidum TaxID=119954 RepID=A0ACB9RZL0_9MYRT|nr:hypothetical protein MLD38_009904 [Melastoma candidum]